MAAVPPKIAKALIPEEKDCKETIETPTSAIACNSLNAPKHGTVIPNRVFVGGISSSTTEADLMNLFSNYGTVTGAKIIADRAGVSKGYGFVTFETEEEAKRLQKDADNIILRERRLNIAPAIKKQGYGRPPTTFECSPTTPMPLPSPVYRHNGFTFTFHNGMAFFQPTPQPLPPAHMEPPVYQQSPPFGVLPQGSPAPTFQYPYSQGQVIYQAPPQYPYPISQYEGCYDSQVMVPDTNLVVPQYYLSPDISVYPSQTMHPQEASPSLQHPIMYASPRAFDSAILYSTEGGSGGRGSRSQHQHGHPHAQQPGGQHHRGESGKWGPANGKEEDGGSQPLTPPITPKSDSGRGATQSQADDLVKSIQAVAI